MKILGITASSVFKTFIDNFNRSTSGSLGTPSGGGVWIATSGTWTADGAKATSATAASSYPVASAELYTNAPTIDLDTDGAGAGVAFWVSDSNNWFGVVPWRDTNTVYTQLSQTNYSSQCNAYGSVCNAYQQKVNCTSYTYTTINARYAVYGKECQSFAGNNQCTTYSQTCNTYTQTSSTSYSQQTSYSAGTRYLRLLKKVSGTVSTVADQAVNAAVASIKVIVNSGGTITARAYSSAGQVSQTGSDLVNTPASPTKATKHGILLAPSGSDTQQTKVDNLSMKGT